MQLSGARTAWILGVFAATYVAVVVGYGPSNDDSAAIGMIAYVAVALSVPLLLAVHELGHAAAILVGYRVTGIGVVNALDGWTLWEPGRRSESTGRTIVALLGGSVATLAVVTSRSRRGGAREWSARRRW